MHYEVKHLSRRTFAGLAAGAAACSLGMGAAWAEDDARKNALRTASIPLFDGKTLDGWIDIENNATSLSVDQIRDPGAFANRIATGADPLSIFLRGRLEPLVKVDLTTYSATNANAKILLSAMVKDINQLLAGPSIYDASRFNGIALRPETEDLLKQKPSGVRVSRLNKLLLEDAYTSELTKSPAMGWTVKDGAIASTGVGRGVLYTAKDYSRYRLTLSLRHLSGQPDHYACILLFCVRPQADEAPLDALGGIQFGLPRGNHWDYRGGNSNLGDPYFTALAKLAIDEHAWSQVEILADATRGTARMAVAQPPGSKAVEVLDFKDPAGGRVGPIALQMHNAGLFDEYKDLSIEPDPQEDRLISVG